MNMKAVQGFEDRLRLARKEKNITLAALMERSTEYFTNETSFSFTTLCNYSRGAGIPSNDRLELLAKALGVEYKWLKTGKGPMWRKGQEPHSKEEAAHKTEKAAPAEDLVKGTLQEETPLEEVPPEKTFRKRESAREVFSPKEGISSEAAGGKWNRSLSAEKMAAERASEKASENPTVILQYGEEDIDLSNLAERCRNAWIAQYKGKIRDIKSFILYVRPEEGAAHWVMNEKDTGSVLL